MTIPDHAHARPPAAEAERRRAAHRARMEADRTKRDAEADQQARADQRVDQAAAVGLDVLPAGVGAALAAMLEAMKPFRASDGHMSSAMVSRSSPEVLALAEALLAAPPPASEAERVLEGLVEEVFQLRAKLYALPRDSDFYEAIGAGKALELVETAHQRLAERDRGRERG